MAKRKRDDNNEVPESTKPRPQSRREEPLCGCEADINKWYRRKYVDANNKVRCNVCNCLTSDPRVVR